MTTSATWKKTPYPSVEEWKKAVSKSHHVRPGETVRFRTSASSDSVYASIEGKMVILGTFFPTGAKGGIGGSMEIDPNCGWFHE